MSRIPIRAGACVIACLCFSTVASPQGVNVTGQVELIRPGRSRKAAENSNAVVWLVPTTETRNAAPSQVPHRTYLLAQQHKRFDPHVLVIPVGSVVEFPNLDPFFHNVFSLFEGKRFDLGLYEAGTSHVVKFDKPGISYIFCNIHPEMSAVVIALNTPYYGISSPSGEVTIRSVPPGPYRIQAWHERSSLAVASGPRELTVSAEQHSLGIIRLPESGDLIARHKNKYSNDYIPPNPPSSLYEQP